MNYSESINTLGKHLIKHKSKNKLGTKGKNRKKNNEVKEPFNGTVTQIYYLNYAAMTVYTFSVY